MGRKHTLFFVGILIISLSLIGCSLIDERVNVIDMKTAISIDANLAPVEPTDTFPSGTPKIFCWFKWQDSPVGTPLVAKWDYVTEKIHVLDYAFSIPRRNGMGGISLAMPEGKVLLPGSYKISLVQGKKTLKSVTFQVQEATQTPPTQPSEKPAATEI